MFQFMLPKTVQQQQQKLKGDKKEVKRRSGRTGIRTSITVCSITRVLDRMLLLKPILLSRQIRLIRYDP
ncbi:hypothetical protein NC653_019102 [Populus alba x Populus x berolinensis]|uniref:Uncharacterized protein n=1 Tax=Populus alba x Populus x berolinensis TaxID=444605 RepID=A0AAD6QI43_9ROSI|nr:hypothetical protein NC653_019102 [Populus alba x Populus x berolinensis]